MVILVQTWLVEADTTISGHFLWAEMEIILFIHFYPPKYAHGQSLRHILDKITKWHFLRTSNEVIWPMHLAHAWVKKCHFGNFSRILLKLPKWQKLANWLDWPALLVQPSISAHRKWPEMVVSASTNQVWTKITIGSYAHVFCHSESDTSSVYCIIFGTFI